MKRFVYLSSLTLLAALGASAQGIFPLLPPSVSTVPSNGDVNPYGVVIVPKTLLAGGGLRAGEILVSNFNNAQNLQGTGTTIQRVSSSGAVSTFYTSGVRGLTAALGVLSNGVVLVGNLPTADGTSATVTAGQLSVLDRFGDFVGTVGGPGSVDGPWGMAVDDLGTNGTGTAHVFLSNVLNGTVQRFDITYGPGFLNATVTAIATGLNHRGDPAALELGPSGLAFDAAHNRLLVASSLDNAIYTIANPVAATGPQSPIVLVANAALLHGPLDIALLPNGNFVVANSDGSNADANQPSELVEFTSAGTFVDQMSIDANNGGAFGLGINNIGWGTFQLAAVDDNANSLLIRTAVVK